MHKFTNHPEITPKEWHVVRVFGIEDRPTPIGILVEMEDRTLSARVEYTRWTDGKKLDFTHVEYYPLGGKHWIWLCKKDWLGKEALKDALNTNGEHHVQ